MNYTSNTTSEIILICWFAAKETFPILSNVKKHDLAHSDNHTFSLLTMDFVMCTLGSLNFNQCNYLQYAVKDINQLHVL